MVKWINFNSNHLAQNNTGYIEHLGICIKEAVFTFLYFIKVIIHGILPQVFTMEDHNMSFNLVKRDTPKI